MVHLMVGCQFKDVYSQELFDYLLGGEQDSYLWFNLKLASYDYSDKKQNNLLARRSMPLNYAPYFLEDLVEQIVYQNGAESFGDDQKSVKDNAVYFARILFLIGDYQRALKHLLDYEFYVESTTLAVAMLEI